MRVEKTVNGVETHYLLDKNRDYAQVLQETDQNGTIIVDYIYGDDLISQKRSSLTSYYHYDGQLSTRQLTNASANITDGYTYDAFGILLNMFGATENNYLYTGEQYDPNVGFYYLRARYYNASIGRFLTMDAFSGMQFEPASLHKYLYCEGNPVNDWDPSGEMDIALGTTGITINISISKILIYSSAIILGTAVGTLIETLKRNLRYRVYHVTTWDGLMGIMATGHFLPGLDGWLYFSAGPYFFGRSAGRKLSLRKKPDVCISIITYPLKDRLRPVWKEPRRAESQPNFGTGRVGGGFEYYTDIPIPYYSRMPFWWPLLF